MKSPGKYFWLALSWLLLLSSGGRIPAQIFNNLHNFAFTDGTDPEAGLVLSSNTLFGTTRIYGGGNGGGSGSVFRLNTDGSSFTNLHTFTQGTDGGNLSCCLLLSGERLYGTATFGGGSNFGCVFAINSDGTDLTNVYSFSELELATFPNTNSDGAYPAGGVILSGATLYGTGYEGGAIGWGTIYGVNTNGGSFTNLHNFNFVDGQYPSSSLILSGKTLYGATPDGGNGYGTLFKIGTNGLGYTNFYDFSAAPAYPYTNIDGANPSGSLVLAGNTLYGTAAGGGSAANGTIFKINIDGTGFAKLHDFSATNNLGFNADGAEPRAGLVLSGNFLYGTASAGGRSGGGTVFQLSTEGTVFTTLYDFSKTNASTGTNTDGATPVGGVILTSNVIYGTASTGGDAGYGTVFSIVLPPLLSLAPAGTNVILTWPDTATGYLLQSATALVPPVKWSNLSGQYNVTNPVSGTQTFFRLAQPQN